MKLLCTAALVWLLAMGHANAQVLPNRDSVLHVMMLTNGYFMQKWPDTGKPIVTNKERPSHIWTRGVYYEGLMALHTIYPKAEFYDYAMQWANAHEWGLHRGNTTRNADNQCAGQTYIDLYNIEPEPSRIKNIKVCMDMLVNTPQNDDWSWIDAIQMAMPILAKMGVLYNDDRYFEKMYQMYMYAKTQHGDKGLYNPKDGLWWRDKDFDPPYAEPNGEDCYWSRGNGWVFAALVKVMEIMPANGPHRNEYLKTFNQMAQALLKVQRTDGFWNPSLHDPNNYGSKETSGTALFVYGMAWGINNKVLDRQTYLPVVLKAWQAMVSESVHPNGFLGYVQGTGKEPKDGQPVTYDHEPDFEDYGLGCFLLAGAQVYKITE